MSKQNIRWTSEQYEAYCRIQGIDPETGPKRAGETASAASGVAEVESPQGEAHRATVVRKMKEMNGTETGFFAIQQARVRKGELISCIYEPVSFAIGGGVRYKVDFMLRYPDNRLEFIEIKGRKIWTQDLVRYKIAADRWGWMGEFQLWQGIRGNYERIR